MSDGPLWLAYLSTNAEAHADYLAYLNTERERVLREVIHAQSWESFLGYKQTLLFVDNLIRSVTLTQREAAQYGRYRAAAQPRNT